MYIFIYVIYPETMNHQRFLVAPSDHQSAKPRSRGQLRQAAQQNHRGFGFAPWRIFVGSGSMAGWFVNEAASG